MGNQGSDYGGPATLITNTNTMTVVKRGLTFCFFEQKMVEVLHV